MDHIPSVIDAKAILISHEEIEQSVPGDPEELIGFSLSYDLRGLFLLGRPSGDVERAQSLLGEGLRLLLLLDL